MDDLKPQKKSAGLVIKTYSISKPEKRQEVGPWTPPLLLLFFARPMGDGSIGITRCLAGERCLAAPRQ